VLEYPGLRAEVLADIDGHPTRVRFRFPHSLDDPRYLFVTATARGINRWTVPPVRGSTVVPLARLPSPRRALTFDPLPNSAAAPGTRAAPVL
jgi:hypothetical protein